MNVPGRSVVARRGDRSGADDERGIGQTMAERASASGFHRACAARSGSAAAEFAVDGMRAPRMSSLVPAASSRPCGGDLTRAAAGGAKRLVRDRRGDAAPLPDERVRPVGRRRHGRPAPSRLRRDASGRRGSSDRLRPVRRPAGERPLGPRRAVAAAWTTAIRGESTTNSSTALTRCFAGGCRRGRRACRSVTGDRPTALRASTSETGAADFAHPATNPALACEKWERLGIVDRRGDLAGAYQWLSSDERLDHRRPQRAGRCR